MTRAHILVYDTLLEDSVDQMCGYVHVGDGAGVTGAHVTTWNPTDFARLMKWGEVTLSNYTSIIKLLLHIDGLGLIAKLS